MVAALLTASGALLAALVGVVAQYYVPLWLDARRARRLGFGDLEASVWEVQWWADDEDAPYVADEVRIDRIRGTSVLATGKDRKGRYALRGELSPHGMIPMTYTSIDRGCTLTGVVLMKLDPTGRRMEGRWWGHTEGDAIRGGRVVWTRA